MNTTTPRLTWGIKASFRQYVAAITDGAESLSEGAFVEDGVFSFPLLEAIEGEYRFQGRVDITGYNGLLSVQVQNPWLHVSEGAWWVTVVDPAYRGDLDKRIRFCSLGNSLPDKPSSDTTVLPAQLESAATRMFDDVYPPGAELDNITVVLAALAPFAAEPEAP